MNWLFPSLILACLAPAAQATPPPAAQAAAAMYAAVPQAAPKEPPTLDIKDSYQATSAGYVAFKPATTAVSILYIGLSGQEPFPMDVIGGNPLAFVLFTRGLPDGAYKFAAVASSATGEQLRKDFVVVVGNSPTPVPPGPVPPGPTPPGPTPTPGAKVWLVTVDETANRTEAIGRLMADYDFWKSLESAGHKWRHFDASDPQVKSRGYDADLTKAGVTGPGLILIDQATGKVLGAVALPNDKAGVSAYLKQIVGG